MKISLCEMNSMVGVSHNTYHTSEKKILTDFNYFFTASVSPTPKTFKTR